jgi:hypothetical protein
VTPEDLQKVAITEAGEPADFRIRGGGHKVSIDKDSREDPVSVSYNPSKEQGKLEDAGWERVDRQGKLFWKNPQSGRLYPQGAAVQRLQAITASEESEGDS